MPLTRQVSSRSREAERMALDCGYQMELVDAPAALQRLELVDMKFLFVSANGSRLGSSCFSTVVTCRGGVLGARCCQHPWSVLP